MLCNYQMSVFLTFFYIHNNNSDRLNYSNLQENELELKCKETAHCRGGLNPCSTFLWPTLCDWTDNRIQCRQNRKNQFYIIFKFEK